MATFLLELGTEELPADFVNSALQQWREQIPQTLQTGGLGALDIQVYGTPRRLAVMLAGLPERQPDRDQVVKGPPAQAAFKDGQPTAAAQGFARKQGVSLDALEIRETPKGDFVFALKTITGQATMTILADLIPAWITGLEGKRFMRWSDGNLRFSRPIRWLVALLDDQIVPVQLELGEQGLAETDQVQIVSDRHSRGHRVLQPEPVTLQRAADYRDALESAAVLVDPQQRQIQIEAAIAAAAKTVGGVAAIPTDLLAEVTNLVEWPTAIVGSFDADFLQLPPEVITTVMISHQRYFPIYQDAVHEMPDATQAEGILSPNFVAIANGDPAKTPVITAGNERVIRARLADAQFFYQADCRDPLERYLPKLEAVTFQEALGSLAAKVKRLTQIAQALCQQLQLSDLEQQHVLRTAQLCKADLVTQMVYEFPELQGVMGQKYALVGQEPAAVATGIFEHYLPRGAADRCPDSQTGQLVGLADRLDTLVSIFGLGLIPSGSSDPFALRRAANAIVNIIWSGAIPLNLQQVLQDATVAFAGYFPKLAVEPEILLTQLQDFFIQRIQTLLQDEHGIDYDLVNAVLGEADTAYTQRALKDLLDCRERARFLQSIRADGRLDLLYLTVNRATRLAAQGDLDLAILQPEQVVDPTLFQQASEQNLFAGLQASLPRIEAAQAERNYEALVDAMLELAPILAAFLDGDDSVMVMVEDLPTRRNRLSLLAIVRNQARVVADFGAIVKGGA
ncbi:MAG: glycine--tRNA ligase subunit beta [Cyanobacteria bacterium P01_H01_bin.121]